MSVQDRLQRDRQKDLTGWVHHVQPPTLPGCADLDGLLADVLDGLQGEAPRRREVQDFDTRIVSDELVTVHQMKVAAH